MEGGTFSLKKLILILLVITYIIPNGLNSVSAVDLNEINVFINGDRLHFDEPPIIVDGRTLVPMRKIFEVLGYTVEWNDTRQRVVAVKGNSSIQLDIGDTLAILDNYESAVSLEVPAQIINGRTMVPLRFVGQTSGYDVLWDDANNSVYVETQNIQLSSIQKQNQTVALCGDLLYFKTGQSTYKISLGSGESGEVSQDEVVATAFALHDRDRLPEGVESDYLIMDDCIYYIANHTNYLMEKSLKTGEIKAINDSWTISFDGAGGKIYYTSADYYDTMSIWPPTKCKGLFSYDVSSGETASLLEGKISEIRVCGDNLYYSTFAQSKTDLYRYNLKSKYNINFANDVSGFEIHGNYIFYYKIGGVFKEDSPMAKEPQLYMCGTDGFAFPVAAMILVAGLSQSHVDGNTPDDEHFDEYLKRDITKYFADKGIAEYTLLRKSPSQTGTSYPHYYAWVTVKDDSGNVMTEGATCLNAMDKEGFAITDFITKEQILEDPGIVEKIFPMILHKRIIELAGL